MSNYIEKVEINPILLQIAKNFKAAHTSEPDSVKAIALMIAMNWRTNTEPYLATMREMKRGLNMPEKLAKKLHPFLVTQGYLLGQLINDHGFYSEETNPEMGYPNYEKIVRAVGRMRGNFEKARKEGSGDWWWGDMNWPHFTFVNYLTTYQAINKKILFMRG